jgi:hypothetical protein
MDDDLVFQRTRELVSQIRRLGIRMGPIRADVNGTRKGSGVAFDRRLRALFPSGVSLCEPDKYDKAQRVRALGIEIKRGRIKCVAGDSFDTEGRYLRWKPGRDGKPAVIDKTREVTIGTKRERPGDHALDAGLYAFQGVHSLYAREPDDAEKVDPIVERSRESRAAAFRKKRNRPRRR